MEPSSMNTAVICPDLQTFLGLRQIADVRFRSSAANSSIDLRGVVEPLTTEDLASYDEIWRTGQKKLYEWENYRNFPILSVLPEFPVNRFLTGFLSLVAAFSCVVVDLSPSYLLSMETVVLPHVPYFHSGRLGVAYPLIPRIELVLRRSLQLRSTKCKRCLNEFLVSNVAAVKLPVKGEDEPNDGCPRSEIRSNSTHCLPIFSDCGRDGWVQVDSVTRKPICVPRLCQEGMVYLEADRTCYDVIDPQLCGTRNMRAFLTAYGDVVCQCRVGFLQDNDGTCHQLYSQGPCEVGEVFAYNETTKELVCSPRTCEPGTLPYLDGCYELGSTLPCKETGFLGISYLKFGADCWHPRNVQVDNQTIERAVLTSKLDQSSEELDEEYDRSDSTFHDMPRTRQPKESQSRIRKRQGAIFITPILNTCLPGSKREVNWKCNDGTLAVHRSRLTRQTSTSKLFCPANLFLSKTGHCVARFPARCACGFVRNQRTFQCELKAMN